MSDDGSGRGVLAIGGVLFHVDMYDPSPPLKGGFRTSGSRVLALRVGVMVSNISSGPGGTLCSECLKEGLDPATAKPSIPAEPH